jgi:hypothetical protein
MAHGVNDDLVFGRFVENEIGVKRDRQPPDVCNGLSQSVFRPDGAHLVVAGKFPARGRRL